jgi:hypothetical protein
MKRAIQFLALALCARAAVAQSTVAPRRFEVMAGVNLANISGDADTDMRTGLVIGAGLIHPLAPNWAFQPELTYSMKGAKADLGENTTGTIKLSYLELPLLLRYDAPMAGEVHPFFHAGPALALQVGCDIAGSFEGISASTSCDNADLDAKSFDVGAMVGGGIAFKHMQHTISIGVRYNFGLMKVFDADEDPKNRVLSFVGTFEWPW